MGYKGLVAQVQLGHGGMLTDEAPTVIPISNLIKCRNCTIDNGSITNEPGSLRWNKSQTYYNITYNTDGTIASRTLDGSGVVAIYDWFPVPDLQYTIVVTRLGKVYRFQNQWEYIEITANTSTDSNGESAPAFLSIIDSVTIVQGGQEAVGLPRKLFIFTGGSQVQVIAGTNTYRTNMSNPAVDWVGGFYPVSGVLFNGRLFAWGNTNFPHNVYASNALNNGTSAFGNEDFTAPFNTNVTNIFPGESQKVVAAFNYKGRLQVAKYPRGLYYLVTPNAYDPTGWYYSKLSDDIGTTSPFALCNVYDDYWMMNNSNSITSMSAALTLGQLTTADVLKQSKVSNFFADIISPLGVGVRQALFNTQTKKAYFLTRKTSFDIAQRVSIFENPETKPPIINNGTPGNRVNQGENVNSLLIVFDFSSDTQKIMYSDKDQANCMALIKNNIGVDEIYFGSEDGYVYKTYQSNRAIKWPPPEGQISLGLVAGGGQSGTYQYGVTFFGFQSQSTYAVQFQSGQAVFSISGKPPSSNIAQFVSINSSPTGNQTVGYNYCFYPSLDSFGNVTGGSVGVPGSNPQTALGNGSGVIQFAQESVLGAVTLNLTSTGVPTNFSIASGSQYVPLLCTLGGATGTAQLNNIPLSQNPYVTGRGIYRMQVTGDVTGNNPPNVFPAFNLIDILSDNTTTAYTDGNNYDPSVIFNHPPVLGQDGWSANYTAEFQTPHMDLTQTDIMTQSTVRADKNFDFLELEYIPTGATNVSVDVYIDGNYSQTQSFYLGKGPQLDVVQLDNFRLQGDSVRSQRLPIVGRGRTISFRVYASTLERIFKITAFRVYFRMQGQSDKK